MRALVAGFLLWSSSLVAPPKLLARDCLGAYVALNQTIEKSLLRIKDQGAIHRLVSRNDLTPQQMAKLIFEVVFQARLDKLDPQVAAQIQRVVRDTKYYYVKTLFGNYSGSDDLIRVGLPSSLKQTAVEYIILIHEAEHAIQRRVVLGESDPNHSKFKALLEALSYAKNTFEAERGAMIAEWHYVRALPKEIAEDLAVVVQNEPFLEQKQRALLLRWLRARDINSVEDYVQLEWQNGRYSRDRLTARQKIMIKDAAKELKDAAIVPAIVATAITGPLTVLCLDLLASNKSSPESQTSCSKFLIGTQAPR